MGKEGPAALGGGGGAGPGGWPGQGKRLERWLDLGGAAGLSGLGGWLRGRADGRALLAERAPWGLGGVAYEVEEAKLHSGTVLAKLAGVETPEAARKLRGPIAVPRPDPGKGWLYEGDLVGLEVTNEQGVALGVVKAVFSHGAHPVL